jgi:Tol biopolymer transport system component
MLRLLVTAALVLTALFATTTMTLAHVWESSSGIDPNWQIIFTNFDLRYGQVAQIMNVDGGGIQPLALHLMPVTYPDCSPDGNTLAFVAGNHLYTAETNGENRRQIDPRRITGVRDLGVSNDGTALVFDGQVELNFGIYVFNIATAQWSELTAQVLADADRYFSGYDLSPDGARIAYHAFKLSVVHPNGSVALELPGQVLDPVWSPDGNAIAFTADWDGNFDIYIMDVDQFIIWQLTRLDGDTGYRFPAWSPDGRYLTFLGFAGQGVGGAIYLINADGSGQRAIYPEGVKAETACILTARPASLVAGS